MNTVLAHTPPAEGAVAAFVHAVGGVHFLLALVTAGLTAKLHPPFPAPATLLFTAAIGLGTTAALLAPTPPGMQHLGALTALCAGVAVTASRAPAVFPNTIAVAFGVCYGLTQTHHLAQHLHLPTLTAALVATAGSYLVGLLAGGIAAETRTRTAVSVAVGAATALASTLRVLTLL